MFHMEKRSRNTLIIIIIIIINIYAIYWKLFDAQVEATLTYGAKAREFYYVVIINKTII